MQQNAHVCDKSETCGENVNGETQGAAKALSSGQGTYALKFYLKGNIFLEI